MNWDRIAGSPEAVRARLRSAFSSTRSPHLVGLSFALGLFILALPNLGAGLVVIGAIGYRFEWADPLALGGAAIIMNPLVKGGIYVVSFAVGVALFGPVPGIFSGNLSLSLGVPVLVRLLVGNLLVAACLAAVGYILALYWTDAVR